MLIQNDEYLLRDLWEPDEARYSLIPSAMNETGNYVTPHIKNTIYLEKPPLAFWGTAVSFKIFGENDFSARLFTGLCAWGCILLTFFMGGRFRDEKTGLYAAAVLTISVFPFILGRINILDIPLTFFLCLSIWLGYLSLTSEKKRYRSYLFYFTCALAFLTKGIIGVVFPFAILVIWLIWAADFACGNCNFPGRCLPVALSGAERECGFPLVLLCT